MISEPRRLSHQNAVGTTTRLSFSVAYHCTKKREKKTAFPSQPMIFQVFQETPRNFPSCQSSWFRSMREQGSPWSCSTLQPAALPLSRRGRRGLSCPEDFL